MNRATAVFSFLLAKKLIYGVAIALVASTGLVAQDPEDTNQFQSALAEELLAIKTFRAEFTQVAIAQNGVSEISQSGRLLFDRSGKFLWEVTEPFEQHILVSQDTMRVYDPDLEQLTISTFDASSTATFASLILTSSTDFLDEFDVEFEDSQYTLLPKGRGHDFVRLLIVFEQDTLSSIEILDHFNTINQFRFNKVETNTPLKDEEFELEVPEGTEIVDQRTNTLNESANQDE